MTAGRFAYSPDDMEALVVSEAVTQWRHAVRDRGMAPRPNTPIILVVGEPDALPYVEGEVTRD